jgi:hypothetical protein
LIRLCNSCLFIDINLSTIGLWQNSSCYQI